ncbi:MAG: ABC transporter substrate-binding protein [Oscillospiraceae bacterium]|jgi:ABC-type transport system substrate-binding protein|nr:ABC transporter substrate-binding protein [Oscillospiraceae bacterium]
MNRKRLIALFTVICLLLSALTGCELVSDWFSFAVPSAPASPSPTGEAEEPEIPDFPGEIPEEAAFIDDGRFTLLWDSDKTLNPYTSGSKYNLAIGGLLYEGLFSINADFSWEAVLCDSYSTEDGITWLFALKDGIKFSDGSPLGIFDVIGSINTARAAGRFRERLRDVRGAEVAEDGKIRVTLAQPNYDFPALLDFAIVKDSTAYTEQPTGTGAYFFVAADNSAEFVDGVASAYLSANGNFREFAELSLSTIYLAHYGREDLIEAFESGALDAIVQNPSDVGSLSFGGDNEKRAYTTTRLHFVGFNTSLTSASGFCSEPGRRVILASLIDRLALTNSVLPDCVPANLPVPDTHRYYNAAAARTALYGSEQIPEMSARLMIGDFDGDGYIEYFENGTQLHEFKLTMIVHKENFIKVAAAKQIADKLNSLGFETELLELDWDSYNLAINKGEYDLYYGSIQLTKDFSLAALFSANSDLRTLNSEFLAAGWGLEKLVAAQEIYIASGQAAEWTPVAFERAGVITHRLSLPAEDGKWTIDDYAKRLYRALY